MIIAVEKKLERNFKKFFKAAKRNLLFKSLAYMPGAVMWAVIAYCLMLVF